MPPGHNEHDPAIASPENMPSGHFEHVTASKPALILPMGHASHVPRLVLAVPNASASATNPGEHFTSTVSVARVLTMLPSRARIAYVSVQIPCASGGAM